MDFSAAVDDARGKWINFTPSEYYCDQWLLPSSSLPSQFLEHLRLCRNNSLLVGKLGNAVEDDI